MVRGQSPSDYLIMVPTAPENLGELTEKAQQLLDAGQSVKTSVKLTRREKEVLDGILRSLANKEIASELNLSERTVKFHVSSLLSKFKVHSRMELMREASQRAMKPAAAVGNPAPTQSIRPFSRNRDSREGPQFRQGPASGPPALDGLIGRVNSVLAEKPDSLFAKSGFFFSRIAKIYLLAAYSSATLLQLTVFHQASM